MALGARQNHVQTLKSKFPYGPIGEDAYGVLTLNDLTLNACHSTPEPFIQSSISSHQYWQCFKSKNISAACEDIGPLDEAGRMKVGRSANGLRKCSHLRYG